MLVAVIDLGKTNSKVALVDTALAEETQVVTRAAAVNTQTPYPSLDHKVIEQFIYSSLEALANKQTIDAITITTHGATAALLDARGELALPVLDYEYRGIDDSRESYNKLRPPFSLTGSPALPGGLNIGAQLYWLQQQYPAQFAKVATVLTWPQYWIHLLSGEKYNDVTSLGCHTDLYEPLGQQYSTLVDAMGWRPLMPPTRQSGSLCGHIRSSVAKRTGLPSTTPVHMGIHDSNASLVPHLIAQQPPFSVVSTGTWFITMSIGGKTIPLDENRDTLINVNAYGEAVPSARFMGGRERELLEAAEPATETTLNKLLDEEFPPILLPSVVPDTGPYPSASTQWVNDTSDPLVRSCAITLYLSLMTNECMKLIGSDGTTYIEGPLAQDRHYAEMLAAVTDRPVQSSGSQTGTSVGAAMLISAPESSSPYAKIEINQHRQEQLTRYADRWLQQLHIHSM